MSSSLAFRPRRKEDPTTKKELLSLPAELAMRIAGFIVDVCGIKPALEYRTVCKIFDHDLQKALWHAPTFNLVDEDLPGHLSRNYRMNAILVTRLIEDRLQHKAAMKRPLTRAIKLTTQFTAKHNEDFAKKVPECLIRAVVKTSTLFQIVQGLTPAEGEMHTPEISRLALIAAIYAGEDEVATSLIEAGAAEVYRSDIFGDPLRAAVGLRNTDILQNISNLRDVPELDILHRSIALLHWMFALEDAAVTGSTDCTRVLMEADLSADLVYLTEMARTRAIEAGQVETFRIIYSHHVSAREDEARLWSTSLEAAARFQCLPVLKLAISSQEAQQRERGRHWAARLFSDSANFKFDDLLEDAVRTGWVEGVREILSWKAMSLITPSAGHLFWAVRSWNEEILRLLCSLPRYAETFATSECLSAAIAGASMCNSSEDGQIVTWVIKHVERLELLGRLIDVELKFSNGDTALDAVVKLFGLPLEDNKNADDPLFPLDSEVGKRTADEHESWYADLFANCSLQSIHRHYERIRDAGSPEEKQIWDDCSTEAILADRPGVVMYLIAGTTTVGLRGDSRGTGFANFQLLLDCGLARQVGQALLIHARQAQTNRRFHWLFKNCASVHDHDLEGSDTTIMSRAIAHSSFSTVKFLIDSGVDMRKGNLLHWACFNGDEHLGALRFQLLFSFGLPLSKTLTSRRWPHHPPTGGHRSFGTPLHIAIHEMLTLYVNLLVESGADCDIRDENGMRPLDLANHLHYDEMAAVIAARMRLNLASEA